MTIPQLREPAHTTASRAETYGLLASLFAAAPTEAFVGLLQGGDTFHELTAEYTRLFVLPTGIRPYESVLLGPEKRLGGAVTEGVRRFYAHAGADFLPACLELPDHIAVELVFMRFLCSVEADAREKRLSDGLLRCLELEDVFLREHLLRWVFDLCGRVRLEAAEGLYRDLADWTEAFLREEEGRVPRLLEEARS